jgi:uncharacterized pyridoxamine 5'-phosphate oxidase family protein
MQQVLEFFKANNVCFVATVDGDSPRVRPFGAMVEVNGKLALSTGNHKDVYRQMQRNPKVEVCSVSPDGACYRVTGSVELSSSKEVVAKLIAAMPALADIYAGREDGIAACIFTSATATLQNLKGDKEVRKLY